LFGPCGDIKGIKRGLPGFQLKRDLNNHQIRARRMWWIDGLSCSGDSTKRDI